MLVLLHTFCAIGMTQESSASPSTLEIPPFLLHLERTEAVLCWVTPTPKISEIILRSADGERIVTEKSASRYHRMEFSNLKAGRTYKYLIDGLYNGDFSTPSDQMSYSVAAIGHTHGSERLRHYPDSLLVARIVELNPDFVIHSGDITYHPTDIEFNEYYFRLFRPLIEKIPVYVSPGNHDSRFPRIKDNFDSFRRLLPYDYGAEKGAYYSFTYKSTKFIALSYTTLGSGTDTQQHKWLQRELTNHNKLFTVVFLGGANIPEWRLENLFQFLSNYRVDLVLGGDGIGGYSKGIHGIPYYFTGTAGPLPHPLRYIEFSDFFFTIKRLDAQGKIYPDFDVFTSRKEAETVLDLMDNQRIALNVSGSPSEKLTLDFQDLSPGPNGAYIGTGDINIASKDFDAVSLTLRCEGKGRANIRLYWRAAGNKTLFRLQSVAVVANRTHRYLLKIPKKDPLGSEEFKLKKLQLHADSGSKKLLATLEEFSLVKFDPRP